MRSIRYTAFLAAVLICFAATTAFANTYVFRCVKGTVTVNGKATTKKSALQFVNSNIAAVKTQLKKPGLSQSKKNTLENELTQYKRVRTYVENCKGKNEVPAIIKAIAGSYPTGLWHNLTFDTTGGISAMMQLQGTVLSISLNIGGDLFGVLMPGPVEFHHDFGGETLPATFTAKNTTIGDLKVTIDIHGGLHVVETAVPTVPNVLHANLDATFNNGVYSGNFSSTLFNGMQLAHGTMSVSK